MINLRDDMVVGCSMIFAWTWKCTREGRDEDISYVRYCNAIKVLKFGVGIHFRSREVLLEMWVDGIIVEGWSSGGFIIFFEGAQKNIFFGGGHFHSNLLLRMLTFCVRCGWF